MKRHLFSSLAFLLCVCATAFAADNPGTRYADAFILVQQAEAAERKSDWTGAQSKYDDAATILRSIRSTAPDWNPQMVEYRLKQCKMRIEDLASKIPPTPPPAPPAQEKPEVPEAAPATPPPAAAPATPETRPVPDPTAPLREEIARIQQENQSLKASLDKSAKDNKQLNSQLTDARKLAAAKPAPAAADVTALRSELDSTKKTAQQVPGLQKQVADLRAQLAAKKQPETKPAPAKPAPAPVTTKQNFGPAKQSSETTAAAPAAVDTKALNQQIASLQKENKNLTAQLAAAQKQAATKPTPPTPASESPEVKSLRAELASARAEAGQAKAAGERVAELEKQNKVLTAKLAAAPAPSESAELKSLRSELAAARAEAKKAKEPAAETPAAQTHTNFESARPSGAALVKKLRDENSYLRSLLESYESKIPEIKGKLERYQKESESK